MSKHTKRKESKLEDIEVTFKELKEEGMAEGKGTLIADVRVKRPVEENRIRTRTWNLVSQY